MFDSGCVDFFRVSLKVPLLICSATSVLWHIRVATEATALSHKEKTPL